MNMVVDVFAGHDRLDRVSMLCILEHLFVLELAGLGSDAGFDLFWVTVLKIAVLDADEVVHMALGGDFLVLHRLDRSVEVMLVDFLIDGGCDVFMLLLSNILVDNGRGDLLWSWIRHYFNEVVRVWDGCVPAHARKCHGAQIWSCRCTGVSRSHG